MAKQILIFIFWSLLATSLAAQPGTSYKAILPLLAEDTSSVVSWLGVVVAEAENDPENATVLYQAARLYFLKANQADLLTHYEQVMRCADSAIWFLEKAQVYLQEKDAKRTGNLFLPFASGHNLPNTGQIEALKQFVDQAKLIAQDFALKGEIVKYWYQKAFGFHNELNLALKALHKEYPHPHDLLLATDADFSAHAAHLLVLYDSLRANIGGYLEATNEFEGWHTPRQLSLFEVEELKSVEGRMNFSLEGIHLPDLSSWLAKVESDRGKQIPEVRKKIVAQYQYLQDAYLQLCNDSVLPAKNFEVSQGLLDALATLEPDGSIISNLLHYQVGNIYLRAALIDEQTFYNYQNKTVQIINYYYGLAQKVQTQVGRLEQILSLQDDRYLKRHQVFLDNTFGGVDGLFSHLHKSLNELRQQETYCHIRIKDQLVYQNLRNYHLPQYASWEGRVVPLFEQPVGLVVEPKQFVTTSIARSPGDELFLTGYQKNDTKQPFVAKVVGEKVLWLKMLPVPDSLSNRDYYGFVISARELHCVVVVRADADRMKPNEPVVNTLVSISPNGSIQKILPLSAEVLPEMAVIGEGVFLTASKVGVSSPEGVLLPQLKLESMEAASGDTAWEVTLDVDAEIVGLVPTPSGFMLIGNVSLQTDSQGSEVQTAYQEDNLKNIWILQIDKNGKIMAERVISSPQPHFAVAISLLEDNSFLVVGFKGERDLNALEDKPLLTIHLDEQLEILATNL